jgi:hypothetical protein
MSELGDAINRHIPLSFYVIYELPEGLHGYLVDWKPAWEAERDYATVYHFNGHTAHYWIATDDRAILRKDALLFAIRVHEGKFRLFHCDLSKVSR